MERLDKTFLLTYTAVGNDGLRHSYHAWFKSEENLRTFLREEKKRDDSLEEDLAIEILDYRPISL